MVEVVHYSTEGGGRVCAILNHVSNIFYELLFKKNRLSTISTLCQILSDINKNRELNIYLKFFLMYLVILLLLLLFATTRSVEVAKRTN